MAGQRHLKPVVAAAVLMRLYRELGYRTAGDQAEITVAVVRSLFEKGTSEDDRLVASLLRVLGYPESRILALFEELCAEFGRDPTVVFEHVWAPDLKGLGEGVRS